MGGGGVEFNVQMLINLMTHVIKKHLHYYKTWKSETRVAYFRFAEAEIPCLFVPI